MDSTGRESSTGVPGEFVHRANPADIMPTGWAREDENRFSVSARWPDAHAFFSPLVGGLHDPVLVAETLRQATMLVAHAEIGVPVDHQFVMWDLTYRVDPEALSLYGLSPEVAVGLVFSEVRGRGRNLRTFRADGVIHREGRRVATARGRISCTSPLAYRRIRGARMDALTTPVPLIPGVAPEEVGREHPEDVVLAPATGRNRWRLRINTAHPTLFRRPNDHVPGMLLLEAARQAAHQVTGTETFFPSVVNMSFSRYVELAPPCWITAEFVPSTDPELVAVRVEGHQDGEPVFHCTLSSPADAPALARLDRRLTG
ncbi:gamma-butyrolactone biosynthesis protein ScbA [Streptomyces roseofulvus]|uniref:ScbA/BarX family gamma-butyrolactone biosynthesis protein n=2 Tax=Streptomyces TaxID=1883 RepID=A0ABU4K4M0_9ACTN|nr:ScbA/BarX family gamma-butyrolactone biosynthesis protein [Streptomyces roseolus]MDX2292700.1 ScbA/BarX family gamma-butyrolactone biosynthesis protein [Streptomyces roseolus]